MFGTVRGHFINPSRCVILGFRTGFSIHLRVSPAAAPRGSAQSDSCRTAYQLNTIPSSPKFCDGGRANMASTLKRCKTRAKPTSLHTAHAHPPTASASPARLPMPPAHPSGRACAGSPPLRTLHPTHSRPTAAAAASPARRAGTECAQHSQCRAANADPPSPTRLGHDRRRAPTARARRAMSFGIVLAGLPTRGRRHDAG